VPPNPTPRTDPLTAVLKQLAASPDRLIRRWAQRLRRGESAAAPPPAPERPEPEATRDGKK
jgi:hypothetical protein